MKIKHSNLNGSMKHPELIDPNFRYSKVIFACKHSGEPRCRGKNVRKNQNYLPGGTCPVTVSVIFSKRSDTYIVKSLVENHDHPVSASLWASYTDTRLLNTEEEAKLKEIINYRIGTKESKKFVTDNFGKT